MKCLLALHAIDPDSPTLYIQSYRFRDVLDHPPDVLTPKISEIIRSESKTLFPEDQALSSWNNDYLERHKSSTPHIQAGLRVRALIGKEGREQNEKDLLATLSLDSTSMRDATAGLELLKEWGSSAEVKDKYKSTASGRWNRASVFQAKDI